MTTATIAPGVQATLSESSPSRAPRIERVIWTENARIYRGDCIEVMREWSDNSIDAIVTDPPYGLGFMGKKWDDLPPGQEWAEECLRVLKPGGHLLAFGGTRTWHRLAVAVEDAGFEIRDSIAWMYGSGFPKSMDVSKAIDKAAGAEREVAGTNERLARYMPNGNTGAFLLGGCQSVSELERLAEAGEATPNGEDARAVLVRKRSADDRFIVTAPATDAARQWQGWGTALKPAFEPVVVARKPLAGTVAANVLAHGTGALNIDGARIGTESTRRENRAEMGYHGGNLADEYRTGSDAGRWPANVILDESQAAALDEQSGYQKDGVAVKRNRNGTDAYTAPSAYGTFRKHEAADQTYGGGGGASRFFYCAKAPKRERPEVDGVKHPTVKPLALMRYLVRLVTPPGGVVVDPFAGSGATVEAALLEGFRVVGIEREAEYLPLIEQRIERANSDN